MAGCFHRSVRQIDEKYNYRQQLLGTGQTRTTTKKFLKAL
jgi:hypothetical protein